MNIITVPFAALLRWLSEVTSSYGISLILFALVIKLIFFPFQLKGKKGMMRMGALSKKQQELQKQYANNQRKYQEEAQRRREEQFDRHVSQMNAQQREELRRRLAELDDLEQEAAQADSDDNDTTAF